MKTRIRTAILASACMLMLILDAKSALAGANDGIDLCIRSVIPSLFPFFVLSILLTGSLSGIAMPFLKPIAWLCCIPEGAQSLIAVGLLGGYPVGAQCVAQLYRDHQLSRQTARRLLGFCSNAGPAFLFGIVAPQFSDSRAGWILWIIHILSALLVGMILPGKEREQSQTKSSDITVPTALRQSVWIMAQVCGWVILFRVIIGFLENWILFILPETLQVILSGLLELTNGALRLADIQSEEIRFLAASVMLAFGGICVCMQTASAAEDLGLGMYIPGKILQAGISAVLAVFVLRPSIWPLCLLALIAVLCKELKNKGRNSAAVGV